MLYTSTRDNSVRVTASQAILKGISDDGGLFVPVKIPTVSLDDIKNLVNKNYLQRAQFVLSLYLDNFTAPELRQCVEGAYRADKFSSTDTAPLVCVNSRENVLELWHGPTCAFKDMALQLLPHLMTVSAKKENEDKKIVILVATSGDTGKAALEGFRDVPGTKILVFYPQSGVSAMQKAQMITQEGENVGVCAIEGNFDDAQTTVKSIFTNTSVKQKLASCGYMFSSANSINWGRLVPQIVYYFSAYCDLVKKGKISLGDKINVVVPTGNFGNILACYYAKQMGLPVKKMVCASNKNDVLTDFINTGVYNKNREFYTTTSPSMDILISSNLERLLYHIGGNDDKLVSNLMSSLNQSGKYSVSDEILKKIESEFSADFADESEVFSTIKDQFSSYHYLCDTHTGVALCVYQKYVQKTGDDIETVIDSTASAYKFPRSVLSSIDPGTDYESADEFDLLTSLSKKTGTEIPPQIASLKNKPVRFTNSVSKDEMVNTVYKLLNIKD